MTFDPKKLLPQEITIKSNGNHLYRIGLSLFANGLTKKDRIIHPILLFIILSSVIIKCIVVILIPEEYEYLMTLIGDIFTQINLKIHGNMGTITFVTFAFLSQLLHYYEYKNNLKPTYLKVFDMISGKLSPLSIGLTNEADIHQMIKSIGFALKLCEVLTIILMPICVFALCLYSFTCYNNFWQYYYLYIP